MSYLAPENDSQSTIWICDPELWHYPSHSRISVILFCLNPEHLKSTKRINSMLILISLPNKNKLQQCAPIIPLQGTLIKRASSECHGQGLAVRRSGSRDESRNNTRGRVCSSRCIIGPGTPRLAESIFHIQDPPSVTSRQSLSRRQIQSYL